MVEIDTTVLTDRQVEVIELREQGYTQQEVANELGTTDSNVSAIERAAEKNIEKARRTLELLRTIRAPAQFTVSSGTEFNELVDQVYAHGDDAGVKIRYCRPELYAHLYSLLKEVAHESRLCTEVRVGLTTEGDVKVFSE
ncbi:Tfx family DNA-binding protein [Natronomonas gomsonensis]|uniref:Tfx family DNA-binding protein n=1 Tax=Natronomonas gomsonensis TaxID=1046043 RepID=UPI00227A2030|nr:Tfx family DNA-binding protein [Natronomonas gomsonensis]